MGSRTPVQHACHHLTISYHPYHLLSLMDASSNSSISIHLTIPNLHISTKSTYIYLYHTHLTMYVIPSYNTKCTILPLKPSYPTNACFPPDSGIGMHISALPLIRVTSGYPGDIREGGMHYLPPAGQSTCHS